MQIMIGLFSALIYLLLGRFSKDANNFCMAPSLAQFDRDTEKSVGCIAYASHVPIIVRSLEIQGAVLCDSVGLS